MTEICLTSKLKRYNSISSTLAGTQWVCRVFSTLARNPQRLLSPLVLVSHLRTVLSGDIEDTTRPWM